MVNTAIIQTENLTKAYSRGKLALENLNLEVRQGEIFGYLGPNGAGKTTTIKLLLDLIRPTGGSARIFGKEVIAHSVELRRRIGFLPSELALWEDQTAMQIVRYFASVRGGVEMGYVRQLAERLEFSLTKPMRAYSTGNKRKIGLILALMHKPELLILDEPSSGLDPLMQQTFNQMMLETRSEGRTVFLSSHVLSEVQAICDRVGILRAGKLEAVERVDRLTHVDFRWITVRFREPVAAGKLTGIPGATEVSVNGSTLKLRLTGDFDPLLRAIEGQYVEDLRVQEPTLEETFLNYYGASNHTNHREAEKVGAVS
jgi:ABC-2 type transport system ATP-binding protein